jgi:hypothetical protein
MNTSTLVDKSVQRDGRVQMRLRGSWLFLSRIIWLALAGLILVIVVLAAPVHYAEMLEGAALRQLVFSVQAFALYATIADVALVVTFATVSAIIFWSRSGKRMPIYASLFCLMLGGMLPLTSALATAQPAWRLPVLLLRISAWSNLPIFLFLFPNGRFVPRWTQVAAVIVPAYYLVWLFVPALVPDPAEFNTANRLAQIWIFIGLGAGTFVQIYRYRSVSSTIERQQAKSWVTMRWRDNERHTDCRRRGWLSIRRWTL